MLALLFEYSEDGALMRLIQNALLIVFAALPALAIAQSPAGTPAFDPKSLRGTQEGQITEVLTIGSAHLSQLEKKPTAAEMDSLLDKLETFQPSIITHEGLSGEQCDQVERYKARYAGIFEDYCWDTEVVEASTGLTVPQAMEAITATFSDWPTAPSPAQRRKLASLFLAANDRPSALVQWLRLPVSERRLGDGIDQPLMDILGKVESWPNETVAIGVALAVRLGLERLYAVDDHTADSIQTAAGPEFAEALQAHWSSSGAETVPAITRYYAAQADAAKTGDYLGLYRIMNEPETLRVFIEFDYGRAIKMSGDGLHGRRYVAWFEARNLRMVANIREAFGNAPGARVLNIVGASHKGYYDAYLDQMSDVQIIDALAVLK
ncbi:DUF5694 domain-containing protein [Porphyrobacter sp. SLTP]|uniref:DUF5694 domain-containing protein n=1 Tax=Porphyrobacter sp. SLTP TaxID=2683266 RepID=UPI0018F8C13C|nr:DUF5694 domain-containing protein [Porphyrobacter sp. SLTP]